MFGSAVIAALNRIPASGYLPAKYARSIAVVVLQIIEMYCRDADFFFGVTEIFCGVTDSICGVTVYFCGVTEIFYGVTGAFCEVTVYFCGLTKTDTRITEIITGIAENVTELT